MPPQRPCLALPVALALLACAAVACSRGSDAGSSRPAGDAPRIASLSPALSRTVVDLGLESCIVGRSRYCDFLDPAVPVVGDLLHANYERLIELNPTHLLVQEPAAGVDPKLLALAERHGWTVGRWRSLDAVDDIERLIRDLPALLHAPGSPGLAEATAASARLLNEIATALRPVAGAPGESWRGSTLLVYGAEPVGVFGRGTYLGDVLGRLGATNAVASVGWKELTLEDVTRLDPGAIVFVRPGTEPAADVADIAGPLATLAIEAARSERLAVLTHPDALRPCTGIIGVARELRGILRGFADPAAEAP